MKKLLTLIVAVFAFTAVSAQIPQTGKGDGLLGEYWKGSSDFGNPIPDIYKNTDWHKSPEQDQGGTYQFSRVDPVINFDWGSGNPFDDTTNEMSFSIKWTGYILAPVIGDYTFDLTFCDDAFDFKLYDVEDLETPIASYDKEWLAGFNWDKDFWQIPASLEENHFYYIQLRYFDNAWGAHIRLCWLNDDYSVEKEVVPQSQLYSKLPTQGIKAVTGKSARIVADNGSIAIKGVQGDVVTVSSVSGATLYSAATKGDLTLPVAPGLYVVKAGGVTKKVMVK